MSVRFVIMRYKASRTNMYIYYIFDGFGTSVKICCRAPWELGTRIYIFAYLTGVCYATVNSLKSYSPHHCQRHRHAAVRTNSPCVFA